MGDFVLFSPLKTLFCTQSKPLEQNNGPASIGASKKLFSYFQANSYSLFPIFSQYIRFIAFMLSSILKAFTTSIL